MSPHSLPGAVSIPCPPAASESGRPLSRELWVQGPSRCSGGRTQSYPVKVPAGVPCPMMAECPVVARCAGLVGAPRRPGPSARCVFVGSSRERELGPSVLPGCTSAGDAWLIQLLTASQLIYPKVSKGPAEPRLRGLLQPHRILLGDPGLPGKAPLCVGVFSTVAPTGVTPQGLPVPVKLLLGVGGRCSPGVTSPGSGGCALPQACRARPSQPLSAPNNFQLGLGHRRASDQQVWLMGRFAA